MKIEAHVCVCVLVNSLIGPEKCQKCPADKIRKEFVLEGYFVGRKENELSRFLSCVKGSHFRGALLVIPLILVYLKSVAFMTFSN